MNEHQNFIRNTLLQLRSLVTERLEEERQRKNDISAQKKYLERATQNQQEQSQKSQSQVIDIDRLRRNIGMDKGNGVDQLGKSAFINNYKKEKKLSKSNANYQKFLNNLH